MSDILILFFIIHAQIACVSALCVIVTRWLEEFLHRGIVKRREHTFTINPRGTGEANAARGWK